MGRHLIKNTKWSILVCVILLLLIGFTALYSATIATDFSALKKQLIWLLISIPLFIIAFTIDYREISRISLILYITSIVLLIFVLLTNAINRCK